MIRWTMAFLLLPLLASAQESFQLPSGNIHCATFEGVLRCDILNFSYRRLPRPRDCDLDYGDSVELGPNGSARLVCHGDTIASPGAPVLRYGAAWQGKAMSCASTQAGLRCTNGAGRGFEMSRARLSLF